MKLSCLARLISSLFRYLGLYRELSDVYSFGVMLWEVRLRNWRRIGEMRERKEVRRRMGRLVSSSQSCPSPLSSYIHQIYTFGCIPYPTLNNQQVYEKVIQGHRLEAPPRCPIAIFALMKAAMSSERPNFASLETALALLMKIQQENADDVMLIEVGQDEHVSYSRILVRDGEKRTARRGRRRGEQGAGREEENFGIR